MTLRDLSWRDIPTLAELDAQMFGDDAWTASTWWAELAGRPRRDYVVVTDDGGRVAGYAGLDVTGAVADIMTLAVAPDDRGRGRAGELLGELTRRARARGVTSLMLEVRADNPEALRLYARHGFSRVSVRPRYYQPGDVDAYVLRRRVEP